MSHEPKGHMEVKCLHSQYKKKVCRMNLLAIQAYYLLSAWRKGEEGGHQQNQKMPPKKRMAMASIPKPLPDYTFLVLCILAHVPRRTKWHSAN